MAVAAFAAPLARSLVHAPAVLAGALVVVEELDAARVEEVVPRPPERPVHQLLGELVERLDDERDREQPDRGRERVQRRVDQVARGRRIEVDAEE